MDNINCTNLYLVITQTIFKVFPATVFLIHFFFFGKTYTLSNVNPENKFYWSKRAKNLTIMSCTRYTIIAKYKFDTPNFLYTFHSSTSNKQKLITYIKWYAQFLYALKIFLALVVVREKVVDEHIWMTPFPFCSITKLATTNVFFPTWVTYYRNCLSHASLFQASNDKTPPSFAIIPNTKSKQYFISLLI